MCFNIFFARVIYYIVNFVPKNFIYLFLYISMKYMKQL